MEIDSSDILAWLATQQINGELQVGTDQIGAHIEVAKQKTPFFIKVDKGASVIQFIVFLPYALPKQNVGEIARLLHFFNKEIDFPGFGLDEEAGAIFYRCVGLGIDGKIQDEIMEKIVKTIPRVCETFFPMITTAMVGKVKVDTVLEKAKQTRLKAMKEGKI